MVERPDFVCLEHFDADLKKFGLCEAVRATCYATEISMPNCFAIFELYYPASTMFFILIGELRLAQHDM